MPAGEGKRHRQDVLLVGDAPPTVVLPLVVPESGTTPGIAPVASFGLVTMPPADACGPVGTRSAVPGDRAPTAGRPGRQAG